MEEIIELTESMINEIFKFMREKQLDDDNYLDLDELCDLNTDEFAKVMTNCFLETEKEVNLFDNIPEYFNPEPFDL